MIEHGSLKYIADIKALWREAFGDSDEVIDKYIKNMYKDENILLYTENGELCAMASILPVFCGEVKGRYVYAVATAKEHRGRGFCKELMSAVDEYIRANGEDFAILVPASESLFEFYEKMGYNQRVNKPQSIDVEKSGEPCTAFEYYEIRQEVLKDFDLIGWDRKSLEYILSCGEAKLIEGGAAYFENGRAVEVLSYGIFEKEWTEPFALIKYVSENLKFEKPYFGLAMN